MATVDGVGPDAPVVVNEKGAKQSGTPYRTDLLPALATLEVAKVLKYGADKYGDNNWRGIPVGDHLNHMMTHALAFLAGDQSDDHLGHMACRALMALETHKTAPLGAGRPHPKSDRPRVYIAGPISKGDLLHNIDQATAAFVELAKAGLAPFCPHWSAYSKPATRAGNGSVWCYATVSGNDEMKHADWLGVDLAWVDVADAVLRLPGESAGADQETERATARGIPVFQTTDQVIEWSRQPR
jgi:hypothetical protein